MERKPKLEVSGYRGVWGKDLDEDVTYKYALAFARMIKSKGGTKILIGRDARPTGTFMLPAVKAAFEQEKVDYKFVGILPTPSILLLVKKLGYDGGLMITASHNPAEYNGIKLLMGNGLFALGSEIDEIENIKNSLNENEKYIKNPNLTSDDFDNKEFRQIHIEQVLKHIDVDLIKSKKFKVALDPINSTGSIITKEMLEELGCESFIINGKQDGDFTHMPEPRPENLVDIGKAVLKHNADIGFAQDPDADRLVVINERGVVLSEEDTLVLAIKSVLKNKKGHVVINLSTSSMGEDVAEEFGVNCYRSKIGEPFVVEKIIETGALIGGEGNGGVIYPTINTARDSLVGIGLILQLLAQENKKISEISDSLPKYIMRKEKIPLLGHLPELYEKIKQSFPGSVANELEGLRLDWGDHSWVHIRPSNTEPIVRIFGEATTEERINSIFSSVMLTLS